MRDAAGQQTDALHLLRTAQFAVQAFALLFGPLALRDVAGDSNKPPGAAVVIQQQGGR
jgi:hypothetical protein